jgi:hypothetical protein
MTHKTFGPFREISETAPYPLEQAIAFHQLTIRPLPWHRYLLAKLSGQELLRGNYEITMRHTETGTITRRIAGRWEIDETLRSMTHAAFDIEAMRYDMRMGRYADADGDDYRTSRPSLGAA